MPYIKSPVFAFKYYEYGLDELTPRKYTAEMSNCIFDFTQKLRTETSNPSARFCREDAGCDGQSYKDWNNVMKTSYYKTIKFLTELTFPESNDDGSAQLMPTQEELNEDLAKIIASCNGGCNEKRAQIKQQVIAEFSNNCFELEGCPSGNYSITYEEIDLIVDQLVAECQEECRLMDSTATATECPIDGMYGQGYTGSASPVYYPCTRLVSECYELKVYPDSSTPYEFFTFTSIYERLITPSCIKDQIQFMKGAQIVLDLDLPTDNPDCDNQTVPSWVGNTNQYCPTPSTIIQYSESKVVEVSTNAGN